MPGTKGQYLERALLNAVFGNTALPAFPNVYVDLLVTVPTADVPTGLVRVTGTGYVGPLAVAAAAWSAATGVQPATKTNNTTISGWGNPGTGGWGVIKGFVSYADAARTQLLYWGTCPDKTVNDGDASPSFAAGAMTYTED